MVERMHRLRRSITIPSRTLRRVVLAGALVGGPLAFLMGLLVVIDTEKDHIATVAQRLIELPASRENALLQTFDALDQLHGSACQEPGLDALRALVMDSDIVEDILFRDHGRIVCGAIFGERLIDIPALAKPGFVLSPRQTFWRDVTLPLVPGHVFLLVAHGAFVMVVRASPRAHSLEDPNLSLSRFVINRSTGAATWYVGAPLEVPRALLHDGAGFWRSGRFTAIACVPDGTICISLTAPWTMMLHRNVRPFLIFAAAGALVGGGASVILILLRHRLRSLKSRLLRAIRRHELILLYQPIVAAAGGDIVGAEALMRWPSTAGEPIPPDIFIPAAEQGGMIGTLTRLAIRTVSSDLGSFLRGHGRFTVSINIVAGDLQDPRFNETLRLHVEGQGIAPSQIAFELTERGAAQIEAASAEIDRLRARGYRIYIDDFGTGYSSLSYLADLSIDAIKMDRSFTKTVDTGAARARLVPPIMEMAREIGVPVIVEGVETEQQAAYFCRHGASFLQGWLFSQPIGAADLIAAAARAPGAPPSEELSGDLARLA